VPKNQRLGGKPVQHNHCPCCSEKVSSKILKKDPFYS
jgi:hypothetical protein